MERRRVADLICFYGLAAVRSSSSSSGQQLTEHFPFFYAALKLPKGGRDQQVLHTSESLSGKSSQVPRPPVPLIPAVTRIPEVFPPVHLLRTRFSLHSVKTCKNPLYATRRCCCRRRVEPNRAHTQTKRRATGKCATGLGRKEAFQRLRWSSVETPELQ